MSPGSDPLDWTRLWEVLGGQAESARQPRPPALTAAASWQRFSEQLIGQCQRLVPPAQTPGADGSGALDQGRIFLAICGEILQACQRMSEAPAGDPWRPQLALAAERARAMLQELFAAADSDGSAWLPFASRMERALGACAGRVSDWAGPAAGAAGASPSARPGDDGALERDVDRLQQELARCASHLRGAGERAVDLLFALIEQQAGKGQPVGSLRALYDLWVDAAEQAYGEMLDATDYLATQGEALNAVLRLRARLERPRGPRPEAGGSVAPGPEPATLAELQAELRRLRAEIEALRAERRGGEDGV